jgi:hypothetical protein
MLTQLLHLRNVSSAIFAHNPKRTIPAIRLNLKSVTAKGKLRANVLA